MSKDFTQPYELSIWKDEKTNTVDINPLGENIEIYNDGHLATVVKLFSETTGEPNDMVTSVEKTFLSKVDKDATSSDTNDYKSYVYGAGTNETDWSKGRFEEGDFDIFTYKNYEDIKKDYPLVHTTGSAGFTEQDFNNLLDSSIIKYAHFVYSDDITKIDDAKAEIPETGTKPSYYSNDKKSIYIGIYVDNDPTIKVLDDASSYKWYERKTTVITETKQQIIASSNMDDLSAAHNLKFKRNINNTNELTFSMYTHYYDENGEYQDNIVLANYYLINGTRLRLNYLDQQFDLIVTNMVEDSSNNSVSFTATDMWVNELAKTGYNIQFSETLENNTGTVMELAEIILEDSDWELDVDGSDSIYQFNTESLYEIALTNDIPSGAFKNPLTEETLSGGITAGKNIYVYYSTLNNKESYFQFIYHTNDDYSQDENGVIIEEKNTKYADYRGAWVSEDATITVNNNIWTITLKNGSSTVDIYVGDAPSIETEHGYRGKRLARAQRTKYDSFTGQFVSVVKNNDSNEKWYEYSKTTYLKPQYATQYVVNGSQPTDQSGWVVGENGSISLEAYTNPDDSEDRKNLIMMKPGANGYVYNSMFENNADTFETIGAGAEFVVRIKAYDYSYDDDGNLVLGSYKVINNNYDFGGYKYSSDSNGNYTPLGSSYFTSEGNWTLDTNYFKATTFNNATFAAATKSNIYYRNLEGENQYIQCKDTDVFSNAKSYYTKEEGYYYRKYKCSSAITEKFLDDSEIGAFFKLPSGVGCYQDINFYDDIARDFKIIYTDETSESITTPIMPGEYQPAQTKVEYYYYNPNKNYSTANRIEYIVSSTQNTTDFSPVYNNFIKTKTITGEKSNRYNLLQTIAETFECWTELDSGYENGRVKTVNWKKIYPTSFKSNVDYYTYDSANGYYVLIDQYTKLVYKEDTYDENATYYKKSGDIYSAEIIKNAYEYIGTLTFSQFSAGKYYIYDSSISDYILANDWNSSDIYYEHLFDAAVHGDSGLYVISNVLEDAQYYFFTPGRQDKKVRFRDYIEQENYATIKYGINLNQIQRTTNGADIVTKLIVQQNTNENASDGVGASISRCKDNPTRQSFILDFSYYTQLGILNSKETNYDIEKYYEALGAVLDNYTTKVDEYTAKTNQLTSLESDIIVLEKKIRNLSSSISEQKSLFLGTSNDISINEDGYPYKWDDLIAVKEGKYTGSEEEKEKLQNALDDEVGNIVETVLYQQVEYNNTQPQLNNLKNSYADLKQEVNKLKNECDVSIVKQDQINAEFNQKYSRYIKEGTWVDDNAIDDTLYYYDALGVMATSKNPQVTYSISITDVSALDDFSLYKYSIGDKTYVEDKEFFGEEGREEVIISEITYDLEDPSQTSITVQNYKTKFQDLFQRISATIAQVQNNQGIYGRAAAAIDSNGVISYDLLKKSLEQSGLTYVSNEYVVIDEEGVKIYDSSNKENIIKIDALGISKSNDSGATWMRIIDSSGIDTGALNSGHINTSEISLYNEGQESFKWDKRGITAYDYYKNNAGQNIINFNKFVRLDKNGVYGINRANGQIWEPDPTSEKSAYEQIKEVGKFGLTYDGFFLKSSHDDGYVEISDENDIKVKSVSDDVETTRVEVGLLGEVKGRYSLSVSEDFDTEILMPLTDLYPNNSLVPTNGYFSKILYEIVPETTYNWTIKRDSNDTNTYQYNIQIYVRNNEDEEADYGLIERYQDVTNGFCIKEHDDYPIKTYSYYIKIWLVCSNTDLSGINTYIYLEEAGADSGDKYGIRLFNKDGEITMTTTDDGNLWLKGSIEANDGHIGGLIIDEYDSTKTSELGIHSPNYDGDDEGFLLTYSGDMYINNGVFRGNTLDINYYNKDDNLSLTGHYSINDNNDIIGLYDEITLGTDPDPNLSTSLHGIKIKSGETNYSLLEGDDKPSNKKYDININYFIYDNDAYSLVKRQHKCIKENDFSTYIEQNRVFYYREETNFIQVTSSTIYNPYIEYYWCDFNDDENYYKAADDTENYNLLNLQANKAMFVKTVNNSNTLLTAIASTGDFDSDDNCGFITTNKGIFNRLGFSKQEIRDLDDLNKATAGSYKSNFLIECRSNGHWSIKIE